jgi:hypothetical protein
MTMGKLQVFLLSPPDYDDENPRRASALERSGRSTAGRSGGQYVINQEHSLARELWVDTGVKDVAHRLVPFRRPKWREPVGSDGPAQQPPDW